MNANFTQRWLCRPTPDDILTSCRHRKGHRLRMATSSTIAPWEGPPNPINDCRCADELDSSIRLLFPSCLVKFFIPYLVRDALSTVLPEARAMTQRNHTSPLKIVLITHLIYTTLHSLTEHYLLSIILKLMQSAPQCHPKPSTISLTLGKGRRYVVCDTSKIT